MYIKGTKVKMSQSIKDRLIANNSAEHVEEFGDCIGIVEGPTNLNGSIDPNLLDIRWQPSNLRYAYFVKDLETLPGEYIILGPDDPNQPLLGRYKNPKRINKRKV